MRLATAGFSPRKVSRCSYKRFSTRPLTSLLPSLVLVWPSNWGWGSLTLITAIRPSRTSSPWRWPFLRLFGRSLAPMYWLMARVSPALKPERCEPPSRVLMLLAKVKICSL